MELLMAKTPEQKIAEMGKIRPTELSPPTTQDSELFAMENANMAQEAQKAQIDSFRADIKTRQIFCYLIFGLLCAYLIALVLIVWLAGRRYLVLSDSILGALITSGTINLLGTFNYVAKYLFQTSSETAEKSKKSNTPK